MSLDLLVLLPVAVGHCALTVLVANVVHSFGHSEKVLALVKFSLLLGSAALALFLGWEAWDGPIQSWSTLALGYASVCLLMGLLIFPASTAYLHYRRRPGGVSQRSSELDLAGTLGADALVGSGKYSWLLRLPGNVSLRLARVEWELTLAGLPPELDGLSILHLSDLHLAPCYDRRYFEEVMEAAGSWESDLAVFTGDLVDHDDAVDWIVPLLSRVRGTLGAFSILGNHDLEHDPASLRRRLAEAGFTDLEAGWATVAAGGKVIALGGTSAPWGPVLPLADRPQADFSILLSHCPDLFYWAERAGFDLMLSGHNHGGQIRLPMVGPVFMPSFYSRRFDRGFFRKNGLTLHVSQGIAGKHPVRYGCVPEVGRLVLRSAPSDRRDPGHGASSRAHGHGVGVPGEASR